MKNYIITLIICLGLLINTSAQNQPAEVVILNPKGAKFCEGEKIDFKNSKVILPEKTKLKVLKMKSVSTSASEGDEEVFYYYYVEFKGKKGWIKAEDTNFPQIDY